VPSVQTITLFMTTVLALNLTPGPSILFILSRCLGQGRRAAIASVFGLATASVIQTIATAFGLSALFVHSLLAFDIIKYCGAAYLVYLGVSGFLQGGVAGVTARIGSVPRRSLMKSYYQGLVADLFNPKLLLFFFAFLPQFVDTNRGEPWAQMLILGLLFQVTGIPTNLAVAFAGSSLAGWIARHPVAARIQNWLSGALLNWVGH
jgi:threonine/homoserine/homoserine lactone efflux protein